MKQRRTTIRRAAWGIAAAALLMFGVGACGSAVPGAPAGSTAEGSTAEGSTAEGSTAEGSPGASAARSEQAGSSTAGTSATAPGPGVPGAITAQPVPPGAVSPTTGAPDVPAPGRPAGQTSELTGTVEAGVEAGCVVLAGPGGEVLANLIGLDTAATPLGTDVVVTGQFQQDLMTTCQQGTPFQVAAVTKR